MKTTLLKIVQEILSDMDSEDVNSLGDSLEATQVAKVVERTFYNLVATTDIPESFEFAKLVSLSDSAKPTHFEYPTNCRRLDRVWYNVAEDGDDPEYREVRFVDPLEFIRRTDKVSDNYTLVTDVNAGVSLRIVNDTMPSFFTSFDDDHLVFNSHDTAVDLPLQESKTRVWGSFMPVFSITDTYIPDLDGVYFPYLVAEAKSTCFELFKSGTLPKIDQQARRQKAYVQNDTYKTRRDNRPDYGRR